MNKEDIKKQVIDAKNGDIDALKLFIELTQIKKFIDKQLDEIKPDAIENAEKYGRGEHYKFGCHFTVKSSPGRWNFKMIEEWKKAKKHLTEIEDKHKTAFKNYEKNLITATTDAELVELPEYKAGTDTISLNFNKKPIQ